MPDKFFDKFSDDFDTLTETLARGLLASYLLALDQLKANDGRLEFDDPIKFSFDVPPEEAIDYFRRKQVVTPKEFDKLSGEARAAAFKVGGVYRTDVLEAFKEEIAQALETGATQADVVKGFREILAEKHHRELGAFHLETVFRTNMQMAYGVARRRGLESVTDDLPFWEYHAVLDDRTRPRHRALDGLILPADHEFWRDHFPPWGFNCRCSVSALPGMPDGYDHSNPSGEAQIVYDKNGNPAKAEYGTAVYDLAVGKFQGVPPQAGLQEAIETASTRAENARAAQKAVSKFEDRIRFDKLETVGIFDAEGKLFYRNQGKPDKVKVEPNRTQAQRIKGSVITHNHPRDVGVDRDDPRWRGHSFSGEDIETAASFQAAEIRAVSQGYRHSMRPPESGWNEELGKKIRIAFEKTHVKVVGELEAAIMRGEMTVAEAQANELHEAWRRTAKEFGLKYKREKK